MATKTLSESKSELARKRQALVVRRERLLQAFGDAAHRHQPARMQRVCRELQRLGDFVGCLELLDAEWERARPAGTRRYVVSSLFLEQCFRELTADKDEQFFFITGAEVDGACVLDQKAEFAHQRRTMMGVTGEPNATHRLLIKLETFGHRLLGHFHSHPGVGLSATRPSGIDERFQRRLESAGYPAVAAIFSRDGYIRFFRLDDTFELQIHGTGVEDLGNQTYRLRAVDPDYREDDSRSTRPPATDSGI